MPIGPHTQTHPGMGRGFRCVDAVLTAAPTGTDPRSPRVVAATAQANVNQAVERGPWQASLDVPCLTGHARTLLRPSGGTAAHGEASHSVNRRIQDLARDFLTLA
jgi:hypothetical protein